MCEVALFGPNEPESPAYIPSPMDADIAPDDVAAWAAAQEPGATVLPATLVSDERPAHHEPPEADPGPPPF